MRHSRLSAWCSWNDVSTHALMKAGRTRHSRVCTLERRVVSELLAVRLAVEDVFRR